VGSLGASSRSDQSNVPSSTSFWVRAVCRFARSVVPLGKKRLSHARCRAGVGMALEFRLVLRAQDLRARRHLGTGAVPLSRSSAMRDVRVPVGRPVRATPRGVADTDGRRSRRRTSRSTVVLLFTIPNRRGSGPRGRRTEPVAARGQIDSRPRPRPRPRPKPGRHRTLCLSKERP